MKTEEILDVDYRTSEGKEIIAKAIKMLPPLKGKNKIDIQDLEDAISYMCKKYKVMINHICPTYIKGECALYSASLKNTDTLEFLDNVYGCCLYELMAKVAIKLYSEIKKGGIKKYET